MSPDERRHAEQQLERAYYTLAAACRILCVSRSTMQKWLDAKLVTVTEIGPPGYGVRKIAREEIIRLKNAA